MRVILLVLFVLLNLGQLHGQPDHIKQLENEVYVLNNDLKYIESQSLIQKFLSEEALTNEDKYYAYLFLSYTYKRLSDYDKNLEYLELALSFGRQTDKSAYFEANILCQEALALFDVQRYVLADSLMKKLSATDYKHLDDEYKAKIIMQEGYLLFIAKNNRAAELKYDAAITFLRRSSICDLPMILAKKIELYGAMRDAKSMQSAYQESMYYSDSCGIIKYSIYNKEMLIKVLANTYGFANVGSELDSLNNLFNRNVKLKELNDLDTKYKINNKDLALKSQKRTTLYLFVITFLLILGMIILTLFYFLLKRQKRLVSDQYHITEQLISILSHDIKEPLLGVRLMLQKMGSKDGPYAQVSLSLGNQINAVNNILNNLLGLHKSGYTDKTHKSSVVCSVLDNVFDALKNELEKKNITMDNRVSKDLIFPVQKEKLQIVLYNLIQNAVKYSYSGNSILVYNVDNRVFVQDSGTGIAAEQMKNLLTDVLESKQGTMLEKGSGLGLYLLGNLLKGEKVEILFHEINGRGTLVSIGLKAN